MNRSPRQSGRSLSASPKFGIYPCAKAAENSHITLGDRRKGPPDPAEHTCERLAYSVAEAARALGLSHAMIYDQLRTGHLGSLKAGRRRIPGF